LGYFLGQLGRAHLAKRGGINQVQMTLDQFRERCFRAFVGVAGKQLQILVVGCHVYLIFTSYIASGLKNPTGKVE
jgi:hypothetical protein